MYKSSIHHSVVSLRSSMAEFYYHKALFKLGFKLISIFAPIYLLTLGFSLLTVIGWVLVKRATQPLFTFAGIYIANKIGMKRTLVLAMISAVPYLFMLFWIAKEPLLLYPSALMVAFFASVYSTQELTLFIEISKRKKVAEQRGTGSSIAGFAVMFVPIIGAFIFVEFGMGILVIFASVAVLLSVIPLLIIKNVRFKVKTSIHDYSKRHSLRMKTSIDLLHRGIQAEAVESFWPIFLFITGFEIMSIGFVGAILTFSGILAPFLIGKLVDVDRGKVILAASFLAFISWLIVAFYPAPLVLYIASFTIGAAASGIWLSVCRKMVLIAKDNDPSFFASVWEIMDDIARAVGLLIIIIAIYVSGIQLAMVGIALAGLIFIIWDVTQCTK